MCFYKTSCPKEVHNVSERSIASNSVLDPLCKQIRVRSSSDRITLAFEDARLTGCNILIRTTSKEGYIIRTGRLKETP